MNECWIAVWRDTDKAIISSGNLGSYIPVWDNPISAHDWAQAQSSRLGRPYYVKEVILVTNTPVASKV